MSLPFILANVTTLVTSQLDANYNALGALAHIPCSANGTNTIALTPLSTAPTVSGYQNYSQFSFIAAGTNTGPATLQVLSFTALPVYKDTVAGPVALTGGEIVQNCANIVLYDSTLNGGNGGFHLESDAAVLNLTGGTVSGPMLFTGPVQFGSAANTSLSNVVSASASIAWPNIGATTSTVSTLALVGCSVGDVVSLATPASIPTGVTFFGYVPNAGTVTIQALNVTGASITPVAGTYRAVARRYTP
jgi:hypothetical protein